MLLTKWIRFLCSTGHAWEMQQKPGACAEPLRRGCDAQRCAPWVVEKASAASRPDPPTCSLCVGTELDRGAKGTQPCSCGRLAHVHGRTSYLKAEPGRGQSELAYPEEAGFFSQFSADLPVRNTRGTRLGTDLSMKISPGACRT